MSFDNPLVSITLGILGAWLHGSSYGKRLSQPTFIKPEPGSRLMITLGAYDSCWKSEFMSPVGFETCCSLESSMLPGMDLERDIGVIMVKPSAGAYKSCAGLWMHAFSHSSLGAWKLGYWLVKGIRSVEVELGPEGEKLKSSIVFGAWWPKNVDRLSPSTTPLSLLSLIIEVSHFSSTPISFL